MQTYEAMMLNLDTGERVCRAYYPATCYESACLRADGVAKGLASIGRVVAAAIFGESPPVGRVHTAADRAEWAVRELWRDTR